MTIEGTLVSLWFGTVLTQSIELEEVLRRAVGLVTQLMEVEAAFIFSL